MHDGPEWFHSKRYGLGTGLPCSWQGWAVFLIFLALIFGGAYFIAPMGEMIFIAYVLPITAIFMVIAIKTTRGGWKWRWGKDEDTW